MIFISSIEPLYSGYVLRIAITVMMIASFGVISTLIVYSKDFVLSVFDTRMKKVVLLFTYLLILVAHIFFIIRLWDVSEPVIHLYAQRIQRNTLVRSITTFLTIILAYVGTGILDRVTKRLFIEDGRQVVDEHRREVIFRVSQIVFYVAIGFLILNYWNIDIRSLLIGAGVLTAIVGLSARHTLSSALAGTVLLFSRPFKVGDWIEVNGQEGRVRRITIVNTLVKTPDSEEIVIPNDVISRQNVTNKNNDDKLRLSFTVGISYDTDIQEAMDITEEAVQKCNIVADIPEPNATVDEFGDSSIILNVHFWIRKPNPRRRTEAESETKRLVHEAYNNEDITIPFPHMVSVQNAEQQTENAQFTSGLQPKADQTVHNSDS